MNDPNKAPQRRKKGRPYGSKVRFTRTALDRLPTEGDGPRICTVLHITRNALYQWCRLPDNPLPHERKGTHYHFKKETLMKWLLETGRAKIQAEYDDQ